MREIDAYLIASEVIVKVVSPTIHLNGSGESLMREYQAAATALGDAIKAVRAVTVHGRDYYVQDGPGFGGPFGPAYTRARQEHVARIVRLQDVYDELGAITMDLIDQVGDRRKRTGARAPDAEVFA